MIERRKYLRRQADRDMVRELEDLRSRGANFVSGDDRKYRRRAIRHYCKVHIALKIGYHDPANPEEWKVEEHPVKGRILDLSPDGCSIFTAQQLEIGQLVTLIIGLRDGEKVRTEGVIRWTRGVKKQVGFASGVEFENIPDEDKETIDSFLNELDETMGL